MVASGVSRAVRGEGTNGLDESETWERTRTQGREGILFSIFNFD